MLKHLLISMTVLLACPGLAGAEGVEVPPGSRVVFPRGVTDPYGNERPDLEVNATRFLIERSDVDYYNGIEKELVQCDGALGECEQRECKQCEEQTGSFLDDIGLPWIIVGTVVAVTAAFFAGFGVGHETSK